MDAWVGFHVSNFDGTEGCVHFWTLFRKLPSPLGLPSLTWAGIEPRANRLTVPHTIELNWLLLAEMAMADLSDLKGFLICFGDQMSSRLEVSERPRDLRDCAVIELSSELLWSKNDGKAVFLFSIFPGFEDDLPPLHYLLRPLCIRQSPFQTTSHSSKTFLRPTLTRIFLHTRHFISSKANAKTVSQEKSILWEGGVLLNNFKANGGWLSNLKSRIDLN